jgi:hypothetical protein
MLEHSSLLVQPWTRTKLPDGDGWTRSITDAQGSPLGFVRYRKQSALTWMFWLRKPRLDVFETDDASHLMSLTRSWTMFRIWDVLDAEDRHVGSIYPRSVNADHGGALGYLDAVNNEHGRILDPANQVLATFAKLGTAIEVTFAPESAANPFLRMLLLGCILTLDANP